MSTPQTFSIQQQIEEVEREIALREDVYKRHYTGSNKSRGEYFLARMRAVLKTLEWNRDNRDRRALELRPDFAEAAVNLGTCHQESGDMAAAKMAYRLALRLRPDTFGRVAQALAAAPMGEVWLDLAALRHSLAV